MTKCQVGKLIVMSHHLIVLLFPFWPTILKFTVDGHARTNYVQYLNTTIQLNKVQSVERHGEIQCQSTVQMIMKRIGLVVGGIGAGACRLKNTYILHSQTHDNHALQTCIMYNYRKL